MALARDRITTELVINCAITERNLARVAAAALFSSTRFFRKERGLGLGFPVFRILLQCQLSDWNERWRFVGLLEN
jgi:hypothetical protein